MSMVTEEYVRTILTEHEQRMLYTVCCSDVGYKTNIRIELLKEILEEGPTWPPKIILSNIIEKE